MMASPNETFSALLTLYTGNSPVTSESPSQRPVTRSFDIFIGSDWTNGYVNNRDTDDLRRHRDHCDVTVMRNFVLCFIVISFWDPFHEGFFSRNSNSLKFSLYFIQEVEKWSRWNSTHDTTGVLSWHGQFWYLTSQWSSTKTIFGDIWIIMENGLWNGLLWGCLNINKDAFLSVLECPWCR